MTVHKLFFLIAGLILLLAGCFQPVSVEEAENQYCQDLAEFNAAVDGLNSLTPESTFDEAEASMALVEDSWDDLVDSAYIVTDADLAQLEEAYEDLDDAINDVDPNDTMGEASAMVHDEMDNVKDAYADVLSRTNCASE